MEAIYNNFEVQFDTRHKVPLRGGVIEAVDINPNGLKDATPILWAPGWSETIEVNRNVLQEVQHLGRRVLTLSHARHGIFPDSTSGLFPSIDRKAASLQALVDYFELDRFDVIAHSEGTLNALVVASRQPERVRNIILIGSAGILPEDSMLKLAGRFIYEGAGVITGTGTDQEKGAGPIDAVLMIGKYVVANPYWSLQEVEALARERVILGLEELQRKGVGISLIHNVNDRVFPMQSLDRNLRNIVDGRRVSGFYSVVGNHNTVLGDPRIARLALNALDSLEYKRSH